VLRRYPLSRYHHDAEIAWSAVFTDRIWACGQVATADELARFTPVYTYEFADEHGQPLANPAPRLPGRRLARLGADGLVRCRRAPAHHQRLLHPGAAAAGP